MPGAWPVLTLSTFSLLLPCAFTKHQLGGYIQKPRDPGTSVVPPKSKIHDSSKERGRLL